MPGGDAAGDPDAGVGVRVLGTVRVTRGGQDVALTPSERALRAGLVVAGHRVVTVEALAEWIWAGRSHASTRNRVQAVVSGMRRKVAPSSLVLTHVSGYRLDDAVWTDLGRRETLVRRASAAGARSADRHDLLHEAESLARAPALAGVGDSPDVEARRRRLDEESLEVTLQRMQVDLATGHLDGLAGELALLVEGHPFHEPAHALLMRVLVRVGRQAEAMTVHRDLHRRLDDELGVGPGPILAAAHHEVLTGRSPHCQGAVEPDRVPGRVPLRRVSVGARGSRCGPRTAPGRR